MAPEACQSEPYTSKSDVWSLGCILYELCTLKHAFHADNLLGLVFKIVQDKQDPIPSDYSKELADLIDLLLTKDPKNRPSVVQILKMDIVRQKMADFVKSKGTTLFEGNKLFKKQRPTIV